MYTVRTYVSRAACEQSGGKEFHGMIDLAVPPLSQSPLIHQFLPRLRRSLPGTLSSILEYKMSRNSEPTCRVMAVGPAKDHF